MTWDNAILKFLLALKPPAVPAGYEVLFPFKDAAVQEVCQQFYHRYYADDQVRYMMVGINPGRFGAGITGIPFTDPIRLQDVCGIKNSWARKPELSSIFMYEMMEAFGGAAAFYKKMYITSVSPLGFVLNGKNINYYDDRQLAECIEPFAEKCMAQQLTFNVSRDVCFCIGEGKNLQYLQRLNDKNGWFKKIEALSHPRFIMQYKRNEIDTKIDQYLQLLLQYGIESAGK
jgi:Domain of unknown function (DUF4918)